MLRKRRRPALVTRGGRRLIAVILAATLAVGLEITVLDVARAVGALTVDGPTNTSLVAGTTTALTGLAVHDTNAFDALTVTLDTTAGTVALPTHAGLTLLQGSWSGGASLTFGGSVSNVNAGLSGATVSVGAAPGTPTVSLTAHADVNGYAYAPSTGHFYEYVRALNITWTGARNAAAARTFGGQPGYLATIPSAPVNDLVSALLSEDENAWIGATSADDPSGNPARAWQWSTGPSSGLTFTNCSNWSNLCDGSPATGSYAHWSGTEPNNWGETGGAHTGEWVALTNDASYGGEWFDARGAVIGAYGYLVEYGDQVTGSSGFTGVVTGSAAIAVVDSPDAPTAAVATAGDRSAVVAFTAPGSDGGSAVTGYTVTSNPGALTASCGAGPCTIGGLTRGVAYTFTVRATNAVGDSPESAPTAPVTPFGPASSPLDLVATSLAGGARLSFGPTPDDGGTALTGYQVSTDDGLTWAPLTTAGSGPITAVLDGLTNGVTYRVRVRATSWAGAGAAGPAAPVTPATVPGAPTGVGATVVARDVQVSWTAPADDGGAPLTGYVVSASPGGAGCAATGTTTCTVTGLAAGRTYAFSVVAFNEDGTKEGTGDGAAAWSDPVAVAPAPVTVRDLRVVPGDRVISVSYLAPDGEGGSPVTGYRMSVDGGRTWEEVATRQSGGRIHAALGGILNGRLYQVSVRAVTVSGVADPCPSVATRTAAWFRDPVTPARQAAQIPIPSRPSAYRGRRAWTRADHRSFDGTPAVSVGHLRGRELQAGQAVLLDGGSLFAFNSARLTPRGLAGLRVAAASLTYARSLTCEGYADYGGDPRNERSLSRRRAATACAALRSFAPWVRVRSVGYGRRRPVVVGGGTASRDENRRVVLRVTG